MGKETLISWCDHTFNIVIGCQKVSPACKYCYAEAYAERHSRGKGFLAGEKLWGPDSTRHTFNDDHWAEPLAWNRAAKRAGVKRRVFCGSLCDVFEDRRDLEGPRLRLFSLIDHTPNLIWMLLTKRPENAFLLSLKSWLTWAMNGWPDNVWVGTTTENQEWFDRRMPYLATIPAAKRFISCEPLLGPIDISKYAKRCIARMQCGIQWVIVGGESGKGARPMHPDWARSLRDQCEVFGIPFHFKQWGGLRPTSGGDLLDGKQHKEFPI